MTAPDAFSFEEGPCIPADHAGYDLLPRCRGEGGDVSVLFWPTGWTSTPWTSVVQSAKAASRATSASRPLFRSVFDLRLALLYRKPDLAPVVVGCHVRAEVDLHVGLRCPLRSPSWAPTRRGYGAAASASRRASGLRSRRPRTSRRERRALPCPPGRARPWRRPRSR